MRFFYMINKQIIGTQKIIVMDNKFPSYKLLTDFRQMFGLGVIATINLKMTHLPDFMHSNDFQQRMKNMDRGKFVQYSTTDKITITIWMDRTVVYFADNCCNPHIRTQINRGNETIDAPLVAQITSRHNKSGKKCGAN